MIVISHPRHAGRTALIMRDCDTTAGSSPPVVDDKDQIEKMLMEKVLIQAARELPPVTLAGCMTVWAEVIPHALMKLGPTCSHRSTNGPHPVPTEFIWKDVDTAEVYCHLRCAALNAIERAVRIAQIEKLT